MTKEKMPKRPEFAEILDAHFHGLFPERDERVFYQGDQEVLPLEVHILEARNPQEFHVLYTVGMSSHKMELPAELLPTYESLARCELMTLLPYEWKLEVPENKELDNKTWWIVRLMEYLSAFPKSENTWLGWGHMIPNSENFTPYAENTELSGVVLGAMQEQVSTVQVKDKLPIHVYTLLPLYRAELEFAQKEGVPKLMEQLATLKGYGMIVFPDRPMVAEA
ncbi:suppressor of fused domain protein [Chakrabartyella piscis]|uniref:suppressor of fused domain protein n=1 Tax=Chakrabartyella piscis TaxID=2918914 RepID=UPI002958C740|nr:suppressor of fused domain protein [Chakrabartyella piscis]